ncbi:MAG TPA: hypothetical protein VEG08_13035, partial [Terriglobales bacterium]|nr:hypothetical protein [Terriglobales bacterium]
MKRLLASIAVFVFVATGSVLAAGSGHSPKAASPQVTVIRGATLIDGTGAPPVPDSVIVIEGERIRAVGTAKTAAVPRHAHVIEARGKYVVPG